MKYQWTIILIGVITILFPFLHLPLSWEVVLQVALGIILILTGISIQQSRKQVTKKTTTITPSHPIEKKPLHTPLAELDKALHTKSPYPEKLTAEEHDDGEIFS